MSDLLLEETHLGQSVHLTDIANLQLLPAGQRVARPAELLNRPRLHAILDRVTADFDRIVIDSAPVHLVSDALHLVKHVDYVCLVIRAGETPADDVMRTVHRLAEAGAPPVGFVWNQVKPPRSYDHYYERAVAAGGARRLLR
jgi:Mrp family chromosome partitioning ATPase